MGKTIHEWFLEAKANGAEWADAAIVNAENDKPCTINNKAFSLRVALFFGFVWRESPEGYDYWQKIATSL